MVGVVLSVVSVAMVASSLRSSISSACGAGSTKPSLIVMIMNDDDSLVVACKYSVMTFFSDVYQRVG